MKRLLSFAAILLMLTVIVYAAVNTGGLEIANVWPTLQTFAAGFKLGSNFTLVAANSGSNYTITLPLSSGQSGYLLCNSDTPGKWTFCPPPMGQPSLAFNPTSVNFGTITLGSLATSPITVSNFTNTTIAFPAPHEVDLSWLNTSSVPAASSVSIYRGLSSGAETLLNNVAVGSLPSCRSGSSCYNDLAVTAGVTYYYKVTQINSNGESPASNEFVAAVPNTTAMQIAGLNPDSFSLTTNCGETLAPAGSCTITPGFQPNTVGSRSATLNVYDNAAGSPQTVALSGSGSSSHSITVSFSIEADFGIGLTSVTLYRSSVSGAEQFLVAVPITSLSDCPTPNPPLLVPHPLECYVDNSVTSGSTYFYEVTASVPGQESGRSLESAPVTVP